MRLVPRWIPILVLLAAFPLFAQFTTGTLVGTVLDADGNALPGVTVTISSPALQGTRTAVSGETGGFHFPALPPGAYNVAFELEGFQKVNTRVAVTLAQTARADGTLRIASVSEDITVTASAPAVVETTELTANFDVQTVRELPINRDIRDVVLLAPGVTEAAVNDQITISGAMSFDNLFLVNGVVVNENLRGQPHDLFIEDAVQETTVLTGGVSAEFGRFTGGVVSTLTKSGGNELSGSLRDSVANPEWTRKTAYANQADAIDELNETYEATLGGRVLEDRLWFFTAGRWEDRQTSQQLRLTDIPYVETREDRRWEAKFTGQITPKHSMVVSYLNSDNQRGNIITFGPVVDMRSLTTRDQPKTLFGANYSGIITDNLFIEAQYSRMDDDLTRGAETRDPIEGTLLRDSASGNRMWSPSGCGTPCGTKQHDNKSALLKGSYFLSTQATGNHSLVTGIEEFHQLRNDNNFQSGSDFWLHGRIIQNPNDKTQLGFGIDPASGGIEWDPVPALSKTSDFALRSFFINDKWELNNRWNFNIGARFDQAFGTNQAGVKTVDDSAISPRLAATFDPTAQGRHRFSATYGRYVAKVEQGPADLTAPAGRYSYYFFDYEGPVINPAGTPFNQLVPTPEVIRQIFAWFNSVGGTSNSDLLSDVSIPGYTTRFEQSLSSPSMDEITVGYSLAFSDRGFLRADYIDRTWQDFYAIRRTLATGKATDPSGLTVDQGVIENSTGGLSREYQAVQLQGSYRPLKQLNIGGNYTWSKLRGNIDGESSGGATVLTENPDRPEYTGFDEFNPVGYLTPDMRHRANIWVGLDVPTGFGTFNISLLERYHSALSFSSRGTIDVRAGTSTGPANGVTNPGYATVPSNVGYTFGERGQFRLDDITSTDLGLNYSLPFGRYRFFMEADLINLFNEQGIEDPDAVDKTVLTRRQATCLQDGTTTRCAAFNPLANEKPVEGVHWQKGPSFGQAISADAYQLPRTYRLSLGFRF
ncbi:MAG TPA: TonB-dependent receptor [Thermoanaerobaculia bacterium]|nr:TonB-dependent receptor [Thermoanaerobaculia bacterium]